MSDARAKAEAIRESYLEDTEENVHYCDPEDLPNTPGFNMKRFSLDGHSWNGRPYVCIDAGRY